MGVLSMSLPDDYLVYPHRRAGLDHDRFDYSVLFERPPVRWPGGARVALWVVPTLEHFPLDMAPGRVKPLGSLDRPYPDYWNYTLRDYGNRLGAERVLAALRQRGLAASVAMSARLAEQAPRLLDAVVNSGGEVIAHGVDMAHVHSSEVDQSDERAWVQESLATLRKLSGQPVVGWSSPAHSQSHATLDLVAAEGVRYVCDWVNDDMPYPMRTKSGPLVAMPHGFEIADLQLYHVLHHSADEVTEQMIDHFDALYREAGEHGGRVVAFSVRPWLTGVPHRIAAFERVLDHVCRHAGVWSATGAEIMTHWQSETERTALRP